MWDHLEFNYLSTRALDEKTSYEAWTEEKFRVNQFRKFEYIIYKHISKKRRKKLNKKFMNEILIDYESNSEIYRVYHSQIDKIAITILWILRVWIFHTQNLRKNCVFSAWKIHKKLVKDDINFDTTMWKIHERVWEIHRRVWIQQFDLWGFHLKDVENTQTIVINSCSTCNKRKKRHTG